MDDTIRSRIEQALADLVGHHERHVAVLTDRNSFLETTIMSRLDDINTKLDKLSTMLDQKAASDDADLSTIETKVDGIISAHTPVAVTTTATIDPVTGLPIA